MSTYTTVQGDMWDAIAYREMGSCACTDDLMRANLLYRNVYIFPAGIVLTIPDVETLPEDTLPPWKRTTA